MGAAIQGGGEFVSAQSRSEGKQIFRCLEIGAVLAIVMVSTARCQSVPDAPKPHVSIETPAERQIRHAELYGIAGARIGDWITTQRIMNTPGGHELILPSAVAKSGPGLAVAESAFFAAEWYGSGRLARRHPKLAIVIDGMSLVAVSVTVGHNAGQLSGHCATPGSRIQLSK